MDENVTDEAPPGDVEPERDNGPPIIGIGSSAGGVDELQRLLPLIKPDCGMAFVVVQHLDPQARSSLTDRHGALGRQWTASSFRWPKMWANARPASSSPAPAGRHGRDVPILIARLRKHPRGLDLLFQELLIRVTSFFRDPPVFEALECLVIPHLFEGKGADDTVRVWVPGCSTGKRRIRSRSCCASACPRRRPRHGCRSSRSHRRTGAGCRTIGRYPASIVKDVPAERLERYFVREDGAYRVVSDVREICLFSQHNLLRHAPFSRLDLLSCRNLLIYLKQALQDCVIPLFHCALRTDGYLFLGTSENVTRHARLISVVDKAKYLHPGAAHPGPLMAAGNAYESRGRSVGDATPRAHRHAGIGPA